MKFISLGLGLLFILLAACAAPAAEEAAPAAPSPIEVVDQLGRTVVLEKAAERIISIAPSNTEILFALGLGDKVVGVDQYSDYPPEAADKVSVGSYATPSIEQILALNPDLIVAASIHEESVVPQLEEKGLTVLALDPQSIDEIMEAITMVGKVTGHNEEASSLTADMTRRIKAVTDKTSKLAESEKPRVFYSVWHDPLMSAGSGTFQADLIEKAGGINVARELEGWKTISMETVVTANPQVMIAGAMTLEETDSNYAFVKSEPRLDSTDARQNDMVYAVNSNLTSRPGPRIVDALEEFARLIHPELFD